MARRCDLTGRGTATGNKRSHSERATRRTFKVNVQNKTLDGVTLKLSTKAIRTLTRIRKGE